MVASAAVGNEENIGCIEDADETVDIMRRPSSFSVFGQRPSSPRSNRSNSNQSIPTHPNSLNSDDEDEHVGSDVEKEKLQEGKLWRLSILIIKCIFQCTRNSWSKCSITYEIR